MKYRETIVTLKNGDRCLLRSPNAEDAEEILQHLIQTSAETNNMVRYADEIVMTTEQERDYLASVESDPRSMMISALINGKIIANAGFNPVVPYERCRHRAEFGISIKKFFWEIG